MNTKEAIDLLERLKNPHLEWLKKHNDNMDKIIEMLKRDERYKKMWGECWQYFGEDLVKNPVVIKMEKVKQKYFPKDEVVK